MRRWVAGMGALAVAFGCAAPVGTRPPLAPVPTAALDAPAPSPTPRVPPGLLVPLYQKPSWDGWARLIALKRRHPALDVVAIVNPADGASWGVQGPYTAGIAGLHQAGIVVLGYVFTGYGERAASSVRREVTRWHTEYPLIDGIFFDEMATDPATLAFYQQAASEVRGLNYRMLIGNFGVAPPAAIADTVDVAVSYEAAGLPSAAQASRLAPARQAMLAHTIPALETAGLLVLSHAYRYLYVTDDTEPDPWNTLSRHAEALADCLDPPAPAAP